MQSMWRIVLICFLGVAALGDELKVTTWNMEWFPSGSSRGLIDPEAEVERTAAAAAVLRVINSDILVLQEVRDLKACEVLVAALEPHKYHIAVCSQFKEGFGGVIGLQQVAILSKYPAFAAWFDRWNSFGAVDPPRGFAFAAFRIGTNDVGVYGVHLKSNLVEGDLERGRQLNILKRELAAEQLMSHSGKVSQTVSNELECLVVAGDFNTTHDQLEFTSEKSLAIFERSGFTSGFEDLPLRDRVTVPGKGQYPDATFDYIFVRAAAIASRPVITASKVSDHYPVLRNIHLP